MIDYQKIADEWYRKNVHSTPTPDGAMMLHGLNRHGENIRQHNVSVGQVFCFYDGRYGILIADDEYGYCVFIDEKTGDIFHMGHSCWWCSCKNIHIVMT
jgi:hypothetical protein